MGDDSAAAPASPGAGGAPPTLSVVIPAYDEEDRLPALLETLARDADAAVEEAGMELVEVLLVDDGSGDRTRAILSEASAGTGRLKPVFAYEGNRGKGAAVAAGVARARGQYVLLADVDLSTPLEELSKLTAAVGRGADIAVGSRAVPGAVVERGPRHRKLLGETFNGVVRVLTGLRLRDTQNGFKLFPTAAARRLLAEQICPGFAFDVELLMRADRAGLRIEEVPIIYRHDSRSSVRLGPAGTRMLWDVSRLAYRLRGPSSPAREARLSGIPADDSD